MPFDEVELFRAAAIIADNMEMKAALNCSLKAAGATGAATLVGGLLAGPVGLFIGGTVGGLCSMLATSGQFKPVAQIIKNDLTNEQRAKLLKHLRAAVNGFDVIDLVRLASVVGSKEAVVVAIAGGVKQFFIQDMHMKFVQM